MQRITQFWKSGCTGKLVIGCGGLVGLLIVCGILGSLIDEEPTPTQLQPTATPKFPSLAVGTRVKLVGGYSPPGITVWYMYEDRCVIDVAHSFVPSGTVAIIASTKVCYAQDYDSSHRSYYYKVKIPSLDYQVENNWVNAKYVYVPVP